MALDKITKIIGKGVYIAGDDIDTDRIIPARYMKCITFDGLGDYLFYDLRHKEDGSEKDHVLNDPIYSEASILISGKNFGCGSSREHAPQALYRAGFRAVITEGFAEIFFGNSTQLGMPCLTVNTDVIQKLSAAVMSDPETIITIEMENLKISIGDEQFDCTIKEGARESLIAGTWDPIGELLEGVEDVDRMAASLPNIDNQ